MMRPRGAVLDPARTLTDADVAAIVTALVPALAHVIATERRKRQRSLSRADRAQLSRLLPVVAGALGSEYFAVSELTEQAAVRLVLGTLTPAQTGQLLQRAIGLPLDGYVIERGGEELHRRLWRVVATM